MVVQNSDELHISSFVL